MSPIPMNRATQVISLALPTVAQTVGRVLNTAANRPVDFFLMVYTQGRGQYIGTADREHNVSELQGLLDAWKADAPFEPITDVWAVNVCCELANIAHALDLDLAKLAGERIAFALVVFTPNRASYVGTAPRADTVREFTDLLADWAKGMEDIPAHQFAAMH